MSAVAPAAIVPSPRPAAPIARAILAAGSKSFALASKLLPADRRDEIAVVYAWCRRVDDAIDLAPIGDRPAALDRLRAELDDVFASAAQGSPRGVCVTDPILAAFAEVVARREIPRTYPDELLAGMAMDVARTRYATLDDLLLYCHRVAGVVGLLLCHVMGLRDPKAARNAAHLGIAMQLTNICRDVAEDLADGRVYLPARLLGDRPLSTEARDRSIVIAATERLLGEADRYYASAERGIPALGLRCALAVRAARHVYGAIGGRLRRRGGDPLRGRTVVPAFTKVLLLLWAVLLTLLEIPARLRDRRALAPPPRVLRFPHDVLPL
jgi:phytoene synthase